MKTFFNWLGENTDWQTNPDWKSQGSWNSSPSEATPPKFDPNKATQYYTNKLPAEQWVPKLYEKMREFMKSLTKDEISIVMYRFNQIVKKIESMQGKDLSKNELLDIARNTEKAYDTNDILGKMFDMI